MAGSILLIPVMYIYIYIYIYMAAGRGPATDPMVVMQQGPKYVLQATRIQRPGE